MHLMKLEDYLIEQAGNEWAELLAPWVPPLPLSFTLWLVNRFGDVFAIFDDGSVHMLDVGTGIIIRLAADRDQFAVEVDCGENANNWFMLPLVDQCVAAGLLLGPRQCYSYKMPPVFGGGMPGVPLKVTTPT
jgi:hypothetical protein